MRLLFRIGVFVLCGFPGNGTSQTTPFQEKDGFLKVEAEDFHFRSSNNTKRDWYRRQTSDSLPFDKVLITNHSATASGGAYIEALPDTRITHDDALIVGENFFPEPGIGGIVSYEVNIRNPGKYYVWASAFSSGSEDNGVHVGLDGEWPESGARMQWCEGKDNWTWSSAQRDPENHCGVATTIYLEVTEAGAHTISFCMREDGFEMDAWLMTTNIAYIPE